MRHFARIRRRIRFGRDKTALDRPAGPVVVLLARDTGRLFAVSAPRLAAKPAPINMLAERWDGTRWRIEPTPHPAGSPTNFLNGVTCSSRRACTAVGSAVAGKIRVPLVERWNGHGSSTNVSDGRTHRHLDS